MKHPSQNSSPSLDNVYRIYWLLVALFVGRMGDLYVLLSRRASTLRTYAGDTSLPGGKRDPQDHNIELTARREAFEEIGLPLDPQKVPLLCILEPFLAGNSLIVTPVVVLILDNTLRPILNTPEVTSLFSHPLISFLHSEPPFATEPEMLEMKYHTYDDVSSSTRPGKVRLHRFMTGRETGGTKPIFGLTAAILIRVATIGYARAPDFEVNAPGQPSQEQRIARALKHDPIFREAAALEGIDPGRIPEPSALRRQVRTRDKRRARSKL
ncbi:Nudix hydrolase 15, mitochondrial [Grifola frondosa]|uniref:Nudix hydrolase 15, mitochondrial n=1 Tax=Grifola frondosa TaxID=5627 RepID=A0A1C7M0A7_GRIFR|nr:Nudix hydrolase 15, mitochondrial [Grifola frondosa]